jgi:hypothetical protein
LLKGRPESEGSDKIIGQFLDYKVYRCSTSPEQYNLVLVYFSDCIINRKASELGFKTALQDSPFTLEF